MCGDIYLLLSALLITVLSGVVRGGVYSVKIWTQKGVKNIVLVKISQIKKVVKTAEPHREYPPPGVRKMLLFHDHSCAHSSRLNGPSKNRRK